MKVFFTSLALALLLSLNYAEAQTVAVDINRARLTWTWAPGTGSGTPSEFRVKCGQTSGTYTKITTVADGAARALPVAQAITGQGNWFCAVTAANQFGESGPSNEVPFAAGAAPSGSIVLQVTAN